MKQEIGQTIILPHYGLLIVQIRSEEYKFNAWVQQHSLQGFAWRPGSVQFSTLSDLEFLIIKVAVADSFEERPDATRVIRVPFSVPVGETVSFIALIQDEIPDEERRFEIPPGDYALFYETAFFEEPRFFKSAYYSEMLDVNMWCDLTFVPDADASAEVLQMESDTPPIPEPLLMHAEVIQVP